MNALNNIYSTLANMGYQIKEEYSSRSSKYILVEKESNIALIRLSDHLEQWRRGQRVVRVTISWKDSHLKIQEKLRRSLI